MTPSTISIWTALPFAGFVLAIAVMPFLSKKWWERNYLYVSVVLGSATVAAYLYLYEGYARAAHTGLEYVSFIVLLGSLYVVSGGILIRVEGKAHPLINVAFLLFGALISNIIGTTGASMLLIRPYLHLNQARLKNYLVVFFIFVVSNVGGALTPIGDPPLFLGYLKGVPFFWVIENVWPAWALAVSAIVGVFLIFDYQNHVSTKSIETAVHKTHIVFKGSYNFIFLAMILVAVFQKTPYREAFMMLAAIASYAVTPKTLHREHHFNFHPIREVAVLFFGIFATMMPALDWLEINAHQLGFKTPAAFFWASGSLSAFLDNAPTYLSFLSAAVGLSGDGIEGLLRDAPLYVKAISLGAVFFGSMTYIGNGPNFMVKSIADHRGAHCPSFFGYMFKYSIPILLPIFAIVWLIWLR